VRFTRAFSALLLAGALAGAAGARAAEPLTIRHGWVSMANVLSPVVFDNKAVLRHYGTSYVIEPIHFAGTTPQLQALAAGEVDIVTFGNSTILAAVQNARMEDIRIIADGFQDGVDDYFSSRYLVRNDSGIKTIADLKGKVLVGNAIGGSLDVAMRVMLRRHHLEDKKDLTILEAEFAAMPSMLLDKRVDLIGEVPPFVYDPRLQAASHVLFTMRDAIGPSEMIMLAARAGWLDKNREALDDFFEDMLHGSRWFTDPAHREEAVQLVAAAAKQPPERLAAYIYTKRDYYRDPEARPNIAALQHDVETQAELGFFKPGLDIAKYIDLSFVTEAAKRLQ